MYRIDTRRLSIYIKRSILWRPDILKSKVNARTDFRYPTLIKNIYQNASLHVKLQQVTISRLIGEFTLALEDVVEKLSWERRLIKTDGPYLTHLRFADDFVLITENKDEMH